MKKTLLLLTFALYGSLIFAQEEYKILTNNLGKKDTVYYATDEKPAFKNGNKAFLEEFIATLEYPEALRLKKEGAIMELDFVISKNGLASGVNAFTQSEIKAFSDEGIRKLQAFVKKHPADWKQAKRKNKNVYSFYTVEIAFFLQQDQNSLTDESLSQDTIMVTDLINNMVVKKAVSVQKNTPIFSDIIYKNSEVETAAVLPNASKWVAKNMMYPVKAREKSISGKVIVLVTVDENGKVSNPIITSETHPLLNEEVLRLIEIMPNWTPAKQDGKPVKVQAAFPASFKLADENGEIPPTIYKKKN